MTDSHDDFPLDEALARAAAAVGGAPRPGQELMAHAVADALEDGTHLLVQAGTGTGKSLAYLVPAFAHAVRHRPVVVATATVALQRQLIERDIPAVTDAFSDLVERPLLAAVLKGRHHYLCRMRLVGGEQPHQADEREIPLWSDTDPGGGRLTQQARVVRDWAHSTTTGDRDDLPEPVDSRVWRAVSVTSAECIGRTTCAFGEECFAEQARDAARAADVIVTNHAMLALEIVEGIPVLPEYDGVIIDEGHEWIDRATSAATVSLACADIDAVATALRRFSATAADDLKGAGQALQAAIGAADSRTSDIVRVAPALADRPDALTQAMVSVHAAGRAGLAGLPAPDLDASPASTSARQRLRARLDEIIAVADRYLSSSTDYVLWVSTQPAVVHIAPLSIAGLMGHRLAATSLVVTSATLGFDALAPAGDQPFSTLARALGIDGSWRGLDVGSPFDYSRQGILYVAAHLPEPGREGLDEEVLDEIAELMEAAGGRTLALFSSWAGVERAGEYLSVRLSGEFPVLVQRRGEPVGPLVETFRDVAQSVLVGTISLWQGVDVPGDTCRLVVIDKIPFTRPDDPVLAARVDLVEERGGNGFAEIALPRAAMLLAQGVGRLIRGHDDRGVVAICDPRMVSRGYGRRLQAALPPLWFTTDPETARAALRRLGEPG